MHDPWKVQVYWYSSGRKVAVWPSSLSLVSPQIAVVSIQALSLLGKPHLEGFFGPRKFSSYARLVLLFLTIFTHPRGFVFNSLLCFNEASQSLIGTTKQKSSKSKIKQTNPRILYMNPWHSLGILCFYDEVKHQIGSVMEKSSWAIVITQRLHSHNMFNLVTEFS